MRRLLPIGLLLGAASAVSAQDKITYTDHVRPILANHCLNCHNADKTKADLNLETYEALMQGGASGESVVAGDPDASLLYTTMTHAEEPFMPQKASKRPNNELEIIKKWIATGLLK